MNIGHHQEEVVVKKQWFTNKRQGKIDDYYQAKSKKV
jgi:hypothetical protein